MAGWVRRWGWPAGAPPPPAWTSPPRHRCYIMWPLFCLKRPPTQQPAGVRSARTWFRILFITKIYICSVYQNTVRIPESRNITELTRGEEHPPAPPWPSPTSGTWPPPPRAASPGSSSSGRQDHDGNGFSFKCLSELSDEHVLYTNWILQTNELTEWYITWNMAVKILHLHLFVFELCTSKRYFFLCKLL